MMASDGCAQYIAVDPQVAALKPSRLSFEEAAALVVGGGTAYEGLADLIKLQPGETVLITAASGGVGTMAVQIAVALGARVFGVASARNLEYVRSLGASEVFDYGQPGWAAGVPEADPGGVDALFDGSGGETGQEALKGIRPGIDMCLIALLAVVLTVSCALPQTTWQPDQARDSRGERSPRR